MAALAKLDVAFATEQRVAAFGSAVESCPSIDVRRWHREGWLYPGQQFPWSWTYGGDSAGSITVQVECAAVLLSYRSCYSGSDDWKSIQQRVPIRLTACHLGGVRALVR